MTYYDPFLAAWLTGPQGQQLAQLSAFVQELLNGIISFGLRWRSTSRLRMSQTAFSTRSFTPTVPLPLASARCR
ncbi:hypothetical protein ACU686_17340 [Yinghuangia aomiensis]